MKNIDRETVRRVANLARLELGEKDLELYSGQLANILTYINKLNELDTKDTVPTSHALKTLKNVFRPDVLKRSIPVEDALKNAPARDDDFFKVPQVVDASADAGPDSRGSKGRG